MRRAVIFRSLKDGRRQSESKKRSLKTALNVITAVGCIIYAAFQGGMEGKGSPKKKQKKRREILATFRF